MRNEEQTSMRAPFPPLIRCASTTACADRWELKFYCLDAVFGVFYRVFCLCTCACERRRRLGNKLRVVLLRASVRAACWDRVRIWTPWNLFQKEEWGEKKLAEFVVSWKANQLFCHLCASVLLPGRWAAQSRSWGAFRSLCRTTVARLKFTRTAGNRRPFIDCSFSRSRALCSRLRDRSVTWKA